MDVPTTVTTALADRPVKGAVCLEAGAGVGNTTAGLLAAGASRVYAVTNDASHAATVRERVAGEHPSRAAVVEADLRDLPLASDSVDLVTAHGLFNVLTPASLDTVLGELTRVAAPGAHLVVDDYDPVPEDASVRDLFALANAASELARGESALTFYPATSVRRTAVGAGWTFERERTLLEPVPWTTGHVEAHANVARAFAADVPGDLGEALAAEADRLEEAVRSEDAGRMYSLVFRLPE